MADGFVVADFALHFGDASLYLGAMVDVYVVVESAWMLALHASRIKGVVGHIASVPIAEVVQCFGTQVSLLVEEVASFVDADDGVEEIVDTLSCTRYGWHNGCSQ